MNKIDLLIVNYKGMVDIKLVEADFEYRADDMDGILKIKVRAMRGASTLTVQCNNENFDKNGASTLTVLRRVVRMHNGGRPLEDGVFDKEFFYREGVKLDSQSPTTSGDFPNFEVDEEERNIKPDEDFDLQVLNVGQGGHLCPLSRNNIR
ncbi:MAG: hypothetical protein WBG71_12350 [Leeuwenhoekiella sp.]